MKYIYNKLVGIKLIMWKKSQTDMNKIRRENGKINLFNN